jgi:hypothetical protein
MFGIAYSDAAASEAAPMCSRSRRVHQLLERRGECRLVAVANQLTVHAVPDRLRRTAGTVVRHHRQAHAHRFEQHHWEALELRAQRTDRTLGEHGREVSAVPPQAYVRPNAELVDQLLECRLRRSESVDVEPPVRVGDREWRVRLDQTVERLLRDESPCGHDDLVRQRRRLARSRPRQWVGNRGDFGLRVVHHRAVVAFVGTRQWHEGVESLDRLAYELALLRRPGAHREAQVVLTDPGGARGSDPAGEPVQRRRCPDHDVGVRPP